MGKALYRKYRSKSLDEIVGQEHITDTLAKALEKGRISHAYLFSGPRGVGKTSIARILAHEINGLPYTGDTTYLDIIEIDAASNRRIDEIRDLRDKVYIAPTSGKYKVYIIDEVHMLTREAFNALLKTLEEPPAHVVFILATTEAHKLPETIVSRTQHYTFKPVDRQKVVNHLRHIATEERVVIDDAALSLLADHGGGSFRDSISLLDQARSIDTEVTVDDVRLLLGIAPDTAIDDIISCMSNAGMTSQLMQLVGSLYGQGIQAATIASQLSGSLRTAIVHGKPKLPINESLQLMKSLIDVPASKNPERLLEIILLEASDTSILQNPVKQPGKVVTTVLEPVMNPASTTLAKQSIESIQPPADAPPVNKLNVNIQSSNTTLADESVMLTEEDDLPTAKQIVPTEILFLDDKVWPQVLDSIKKEYNTLYGVLRMAQPVFRSDGVELRMKFAFHQKRLNEVKNKKIIADYIQKITGLNMQVECTYTKNALPNAITPNIPSSAETKPAELEAISNIFGGGELL